MTADIEAALVAELSAALGVLVATQVPDSRPVEFVVLVAGGGPEVRQLVLDEGTIHWEAWAPDSVRAQALAAGVRDAFEAMSGAQVGSLFVADAGSTRPRWFPDGLSGTPRYVGTARVLLHAADH